MIITQESLSLEQDYIVIEKTGHKEDTKELFDALRPFNVLEFVRSGRVAMMKEIDNFSDTLHELEKSVSLRINIEKESKMAKINFGGVEENVVTRDEFSLDKSKRSFKE